MLLAGRYDLKEVIGSGGMGKVYLALDVKLHKKWAVKELDFSEEEISKKSFDCEITALKSLDHKCLPRIVDVIIEGKKSYIVMDLIQGKNLKSLSDKAGGLSEKQVMDIAVQLSDVLDYLHSRRNPVIYRDLKPANIIMKPDGEISLVDFGASVLLSQSKTEYAIGTRHFAAPEQFMGLADEKSDIFSLGKTLRYILGAQKMGIVFESMLIKCCQENPKDRYQSVREFKTELLRIRNNKKYGKWILIAGIMLIGLFILTARSEESAGGVDYARTSVSESNSGTGASAKTISGDAMQLISENKAGNDPEVLEEKVKKLHLKASELVAKENADSVSLGKALQLLEEEKEVLETVGTEEMREYKVDNLSMLATIYRLLGKKNSAFRDKYYEKAQLCIRDLFDIKEVRETSLYRMKLADLVSMKNELGEEEEAIELLEEWEKLHPEEGLELYFFHMCMLLKHEGNEGKVSKLYEKICQIPGATEDFRFDEIESQVLKYTKED